MADPVAGNGASKASKAAAPDSESKTAVPAPSKIPEDPSMVKSRAAVAAAKADKSGRVYRVYCDGIFDLFHLGHMNMLKQAKHSLNDPTKVHLLVGVCDDEMTQKFKGKLVMNHQLRCESVAHCKWVDQVVPDAPWVITEDFLRKYDIDFVAHDAIPYSDTTGTAENGGDVYGGVKRLGKFLETQRTEGISTSDLIVQIIRDYDEYVRRNLDRGYSKESLNVGPTWELRSIVHQKTKLVKASVADAKSEYSALSSAVKGFLKRYGSKSDSEESTYSYSPREIANPSPKLRPRAGTPGVEVVKHSVGLTKAVLQTAWMVLSYINPVAYMYCCTSKKKKKA